MQIYSTVLYFRELLAWYKNGYKMFRAKENKALKSRLINDFNKSDIDDLINTIQYMDFIEDYEVVVVTFESEIAKSNSLDLEIKFQSLQDIYAITDRGLRMLSSGRMPKLIKLEKTLPKLVSEKFSVRHFDKMLKSFVLKAFQRL